MRAALFPGQGIDARTVRGGLDPEHPRVQEASGTLGYDLVRRIEQVTRTSREAMPTTIAQPGIFVAGVIAYEERTSAGDSFDYLLGHSLGEYTALVAAGAIPFVHGVKLISARAATMHRAAAAGSGGMAAVLRLEPDEVARIATTHGLVIANDNSPEQAVLSGDRDRLARAAEEVRGAGGRSILLNVEGAFHSPAMIPATADLEAALMATEVRSPSVPVISNVTARPYRAPGEIRKLLVAQLTGRVRFRDCLLFLAEQGVGDFADIGPGDVVRRLARATVPAAKEAVDA